MFGAWDTSVSGFKDNNAAKEHTIMSKKETQPPVGYRASTGKREHT